MDEKKTSRTGETEKETEDTSTYPSCPAPPPRLLHRGAGTIDTRRLRWLALKLG
ncbi:hypothetical protein GALMADRAFT_232375 [Galerina marginata CBS 339.88]|uniref:Uncharacterized protein n=1 Tax=Galerina marginata (strain CBS 339.88) TaxID=685588 RepID=A0A067SJ74_GALM3|nr:hypothetical protein GALMADRAFT_232375 [Galerina marginata CBS 339.88]